MTTKLQLSHSELVDKLKNLLGEERKLVAEFLVYLKDVLEREIHLELGFKSAFEFCLGLGLSESCAYKRLTALDVIQRFPVALELIKAGEIHLSHLCTLSSVLTEDNHRELFAKVKGQSKRTAEAIVQGLKEPVVVKPVSTLKIFSEPIRTQIETCASSRENSTQPPSLLDSKNPTQPSSLSLFDDKENASSKIPEVQTAVAAELKLSCGPELLGLLSRAKELTNTQNSDLEKLMIKVFKEFVVRHAPEEKEKRAAERKTKPQKEFAKKQSAEMVAFRSVKKEAAEVDTFRSVKKEAAEVDTFRSAKPQSVRFIPAATRRAVYLKSNGQCAFVSQDGRRCSSTQFLQFDHVRPVGRGGSSKEENLRLLCRAHNAHKAKKDFGKDFIESFSRQKPSAPGQMKAKPN